MTGSDESMGELTIFRTFWHTGSVARALPGGCVAGTHTPFEACHSVSATVRTIPKATTKQRWPIWPALSQQVAIECPEWAARLRLGPSPDIRFPHWPPASMSRYSRLFTYTPS